MLGVRVKCYVWHCGCKLFGVIGFRCEDFSYVFYFFFFNDTATTEIYTLHIVGSVRCVQETVIILIYDHYVLIQIDMLRKIMQCEQILIYFIIKYLQQNKQIMLTNFWSKLKEKFSLKILIPYIIIVLLIGVGYYFYNRNAALGEKLDAETKFRIALVDSVKYYKNAYNEVTAEKKTLQLDLKELNKNAEQLNANQKELLDRVNKISKDYTVIAAALVETNAILDGLRNDNAVVNKKDSTISFPLNTKDLQYNIRIGNVIPSLSKKTIFSFRHVQFTQQTRNYISMEQRAQRGLSRQFQYIQFK
eukprot:TRINITY_DN19964_c0_g1_i2.p1 TRINITY_DN19964_c0_g1~~TRINITY_DN19964_c0_g1_i2.p1  ORF type:complete len:304 (-),score=34.59 TRINITY_DN19964_c0_g1_i2:819-1730(-)